ncbi:MAG: hypothetical protein ACRDJS_06305 [Actinomycetota bacterium]
MQHVGDQGNPVKNGRDEPAGGLSPAKAFFALLALLVAIGGLFLLTRSSEDPDPSSAPKSDNFALTDAEAIERFRELESLKIRAYRQTDASLIPKIFTSDSPVRGTVLKEIKELDSTRVTFDTRYETEKTNVESNSTSEIVVRQIVLVYPKFVDESGREVTVNDEPQRQTVDWFLRNVEGEWLLDKTVVIDSEPAS